MRQFNPFGIDLRLHFEKTSNEIRNEGLKGLEFDIDKVSNPNILTWKECNDEEMEDEKHNENLEQKAKKIRGIR